MACANAVFLVHGGQIGTTCISEVSYMILRIPHELMDVWVQTDSSRGPRAARWGWWHRTLDVKVGIDQRPSPPQGWLGIIQPISQVEDQGTGGVPNLQGA